jgi:chemotaxis signal transduction protein
MMEKGQPGIEASRAETPPLLEPQSGEATVEMEERLPEKQYCVFRTGRERFCVSVLDVEEVVEWPGLTRVPLAPAFLMGIFNLRGSIVPIIDIAFTEGRRADLSPRHVVVASLKQGPEQEIMRMGIAADEVIGTYTTSDPLLVDEAPRDVPHCCGMLRHEDRLALALDLKRMTEAFPVGAI